MLVDLTIEDSSRLKVIYGSAEGFHAVDLDSATVYDIYLPKHVNVTFQLEYLILNKSKYSHFSDSGSDNTALYCGITKFKWHAITALL